MRQCRESPAPPPSPCVATPGENARVCRWPFLHFHIICKPQDGPKEVHLDFKRQLPQTGPALATPPAPYPNSGQKHPARQGEKLARQVRACKGNSSFPSFCACEGSKNIPNELCTCCLWLVNVAGVRDIIHLCCPSSGPTAKQHCRSTGRRGQQHSSGLCSIALPSPEASAASEPSNR